MANALKLKTLDLAKTASSSDVIFDALRDAIIRGQLAEGEVLRQDTIAQMFNVSRIPVREALKRLEAQGLVTSTRYKGVVVTPLSIADIEEIFEFRALVEPRMIEMSVPNMSSQTLAAAQGYCDAFAAETHPERWGDLNRLFHSSLYQDANRPYYLSIIDKTNDRIDRFVRAQLELTHGMARARREHQGIMDACLARDAETASRLTREHIVNAGRTLVGFLREAGKGERRAGG